MTSAQSPIEIDRPASAQRAEERIGFIQPLELGRQRRRGPPAFAYRRDLGHDFNVKPSSERESLSLRSCFTATIESAYFSLPCLFASAFPFLQRPVSQSFFHMIDQ